MFCLLFFVSVLQAQKIEKLEHPIFKYPKVKVYPQSLENRVKGRLIALQDSSIVLMENRRGFLVSEKFSFQNIHTIAVRKPRRNHLKGLAIGFFAGSATGLATGLILKKIHCPEGAAPLCDVPGIMIGFGIAFGATLGGLIIGTPRYEHFTIENSFVKFNQSKSGFQSWLPKN